MKSRKIPLMLLYGNTMYWYNINGFTFYFTWAVWPSSCCLYLDLHIPICTCYKSHYKDWQWLTTSRLVSGNTPVFSPTKLTAEKKILLIMGSYTRELILFYCLLTIIICKVSYPWCGLISVHLYPVTLHLLCLVDCKIHKFTEKGVYLRK